MTNETRSSIVRRMFNNSFPTWWDRTNNTYNLLYGLANEYYNLYLNINDGKQSIQLNTATGDDLDAIGKLFKLAREEGESDNVYRAKIKGYWGALTGGGTIDGIKNAISLFVDIDIDKVTITENNLRITVEVDIDEDFDLALLDEIPPIVNLSKAAGVYYGEEIDAQSANGVFRTNLSYVNGEDKII